MNFEKLQHQSQTLSKSIAELERSLEKYPTGSLFCTQNGPHSKWYHSVNGKPTYIPKSQRTFATELAIKKYLDCQRQDLHNQKQFIDKILKYQPEESKAEALLRNPAYQDLLFPYFKPKNIELAEWANAPYEKNTKFPEDLKHKSPSGNMLRSKSEEMIDMLLFTHQIPFRYECALHLDTFTYHPDFTIRHPKTGKIYYWEHFGLMDDPKYRQSNYKRLEIYAANNIIPSIQLITTYETQLHPLSLDQIEKTIQHYFL